MTRWIGRWRWIVPALVVVGASACGSQPARVAARVGPSRSEIRSSQRSCRAAATASDEGAVSSVSFAEAFGTGRVLMLTGRFQTTDRGSRWWACLPKFQSKLLFVSAPGALPPFRRTEAPGRDCLDPPKSASKDNKRLASECSSYVAEWFAEMATTSPSEYWDYGDAIQYAQSVCEQLPEDDSYPLCRWVD